MLLGSLQALVRTQRRLVTLPQSPRVRPQTPRLQQGIARPTVRLEWIAPPTSKWPPRALIASLSLSLSGEMGGPRSPVTVMRAGRRSRSLVACGSRLGARGRHIAEQVHDFAFPAGPSVWVRAGAYASQRGIYGLREPGATADVFADVFFHRHRKRSTSSLGRYVLRSLPRRYRTVALLEKRQSGRLCWSAACLLGHGALMGAVAGTMPQAASLARLTCPFCIRCHGP